MSIVSYFAAVYAGSEGLSTIVFDTRAFGGQAGASARIENYFGFPKGISGQALTARAFIRASSSVVAAHDARSFKTDVACDRVRSSVRPLNAAFSEAAGRYGDLRIRSKSVRRAAMLTTLNWFS